MPDERRDTVKGERPDDETIWIHSHVAADGGHPYVVLNWGDKIAQLTPAEATAHALKILECVSAAEWDAAFMRLMGQSPETGAALVALRNLRGADKFASLKRNDRAERRRNQ